MIDFKAPGASTGRTMMRSSLAQFQKRARPLRGIESDCGARPCNPIAGGEVLFVVTMRDLGPEFDDFVTSSSDSLLRSAYLLCGDRGHAEDLLQTALLRAARRWSVARENPYPYALRVIVNLSKDGWRNRGRRVAESSLTGVADPAAQPHVEDVLARQVLLAAAKGLPARQRAVLVLRFFADLSVEQTAEVLGCSTGTVKSQTHHALSKLRERLTESLEDTYVDR